MQRPHHANRGAHFAHEVVRRFVSHFFRADADRPARPLDLRPERGEDLGHVVGVTEVGTRRMTHGSRVNSVAARIGSDEFFEPLICTVPSSARPP